MQLLNPSMCLHHTTAFVQCTCLFLWHQFSSSCLLVFALWVSLYCFLSFNFNDAATKLLFISVKLTLYLTIRPLAPKGYRSMRRSRVGHWPVALWAYGSNCFSITQLVDSKGNNKVNKCKLKEGFLEKNERKRHEFCYSMTITNSPLIAFTIKMQDLH